MIFFDQLVDFTKTIIPLTLMDSESIAHGLMDSESIRPSAQGSYLFSETNFQDFSRTHIDFSRVLKFTLTPTFPISLC